MPRRLLAAILAALCTGAVAAAPASAAAPAPPPSDAQAAALLDDLGTTLNGTLAALLGTSAHQQQLQTLLSQLQNGQAPTPTLLAQLRALLDQVAATPGLPAETQALVRQIASLLDSAPAGEPLDGSALAQVATLLRDLGATQNLPTSAATLLNGVADLIDGDGAARLPATLAALPPQVVDDLDTLLTSLERGDRPTGALLQPVADLLRQVAGTAGLPADISGLLGQLADSVSGTTGELDPLLAHQVTTALDSIANTPGLTPQERTTIERITTILQGQAAAGGSNPGAGSNPAATAPTRTATKRDRAIIKRIRVNRARTRVSVRVACPRSAPAACATLVRASLSGRKAANGKRVRIAAGRSKVVRLRVLRTARTASVQNGGRLRVAVTTKFGSRSFTSAKAVKVKARHH